MSLRDYLMARVTPEPNSGCWLWTGPVTNQGYGRTEFPGGRKAFAYHISYELFVGPRPHGLELDHQCFNRCCVNPEHLKPMTRAENAKRRQINQTHCKHGHEFTPVNTYWCPRGWRQCRTCRDPQQREAAQRP